MRLKSVIRRPTILLLTVTACAVFAAAGCSSSSTTTTSSGKKLDNVTLAVATLTTGALPYMTAIDRGFYTDQGLNVKLVVASGATSVPGLLSGDITFAAAESSAVPAILQGNKLKIISTVIDSSPYLIVGAKSLKSIADLTGKSIGIQKKGDSTDNVASALLKQGGATNVTSIAVGDPAARVAALTSGAIPAVVLDAADLTTIQNDHVAANYRILAQALGNVSLPAAGLVVTQQVYDQKLDMVKRFLTATAEGEGYFLAHQDYAIKLLEAKGKMSADEATSDLANSGSWPACGCTAVDDQTSILASYAATLKITPPDPSTVYDFTLAEQIFPNQITNAVDGQIVLYKLPQTDILTTDDN